MRRSLKKGMKHKVTRRWLVVIVVMTVDASLPPLPAGPSRVHKSPWRADLQSKESSEEGFRKPRKPNAFARVLSGVFGAVSLTNRRASKALQQLGQVLEASAEKADSFSKVVHAAGWTGPIATVVRKQPEVRLEQEDSNPICTPNTTLHEAAAPPPVKTPSEKMKIKKVKKSSMAWRFFVFTFEKQLAPWWKAVALFIAGRYSSRPGYRSKVFAGGILIFLIVNSSSASAGRRRRKHLHDERRRQQTPWVTQSQERHDDDTVEHLPPENYFASSITTAWFDHTIRSLWLGSGANTMNSGLGLYLSTRATAELQTALRHGLASTAEIQSVFVDLGLEPPRIHWIQRLDATPAALRAALASRGADASRVVAFQVQIDDWHFMPKDDGPFVAADLLLKTSIKYAVPQLGVVLKHGVLSSSRCVVAIEFSPEYPFVRYAALSFTVAPQLVTQSYIGSTSATNDLLLFDPFASIIDDELRRALPSPPRAIHFDLGAWLTYCTPHTNQDNADDHQAMKRQDMTTNFTHIHDLNTKKPEVSVKGGPPWARLRRWIERKRRNSSLKQKEKEISESTEQQSHHNPTLVSQEEAARKRLEDERRKLLEAATAVRRERDRLVAAARSTRQALSDRVFVAVKLQLVQELSSLASVLRNNKTPSADDDQDLSSTKPNDTPSKRFRIRHRSLVRDRSSTASSSSKKKNKQQQQQRRRRRRRRASTDSPAPPPPLPPRSGGVAAASVAAASSV